MADMIESNQQTKLSEEKEQQVSQVDELKKDYRFPIDFVQYIERDYIPKQFIPKSDNVFKINRPNDLKFNVLDFKAKTQLNLKLFRNGEPVITAITGFGEFIFIGNEKGVVRKYSCKSEIEASVLIDSTINALNDSKSVQCIDVSLNGIYIAIGYSNGLVTVWEMRGNMPKLIKLVDKAHRTGLVAIKFLSTINSVYELLTTDMEGNVLHLKINEGFLMNTYTTSLIYRETSPTFTIDTFSPTDQQVKELFPNCESNTLLVVFGSIDKVILYSLQPELKKLYVFNNPALKGVKQIPNASFGVGLEPSQRDSKGKIIKSKMNLTKQCLMLAISWDDTLTLYKILLDELTIEDFNLGGFFNNSQILRMGFLDNSLIYFYDGMKKIKLLNTGLMNDKFEERGVKRDYDTIPLLDEGEEIFENIQCKRVIQDLSDKTSNKPKETYNSFLVSSNKTLFLITTKSVYLGNLLNWIDSIRTLKEKAQWEKALFLGLDIYDGNVSSLSNIPKDEATRKKEASSTIIELLKLYTNSALSNIRGELLQKEEVNEKVTKCINLTIEICLQIGQAAFLFETLQPIFEKKDLDDAFLSLLEPFIVLNRFKKFNLSKETIEMFIAYYSRGKKYSLLTQLFTKLSIESINTDNVYKLCEDNHLFSLLIYLDCHNKKYFNPIEEMHNQYSSLSEIDNSPFVAYNYYLRRYKLNDLLISKTYIRHKCLWYCYFCLTGMVFAEYPEITQEEYEELIISILNFLLEPKVFQSLLEFDSYSFFKVLSRFFIEQKIVEIVTKESNQPRIKEDFTRSSKADSISEKLFDYVIASTERFQSLLVKQDLNEFIARRGSSKAIDIETMVKSGLFLIDFFNEIKKRSSEEIDDKYNCHGIITVNHCYLKEISDILITIIDLVNEETLKKFEALSQSSPFVLVKIRILQKQLDYIGCLIEFINNRDNPLLSKAVIFEWINKTFSELSTHQDTGLFEKFKAAFLEHLEPLATFSLDDLMKITDKWYVKELKAVIYQLTKNKEIQLIFIEKLLQVINEDEMVSESEERKKEYSDLLLIHIDLLIKLGKKNEVMTNLTKRRFYPLKEVLKLSKSHNLKEAVIYIHISLGEEMEALNLAIEDLENAFKQLLAASFDFNNDKAAYDQLLSKYKAERSICIEINLKSSQTLTQDKIEVLWFTLLQKHYDFLSQTTKQPISPNATELKAQISKSIEELLNEMCLYIQIQEIIDNLTKTQQDAEFGQFKDILNKIIIKNAHLTNMLHSAKYLLSHSILYNLVDFKKINARGNTFALNKCDCCRKRFVYGEKVIAFRCGHKVHNVLPCFVEENKDIECKICRRNEVDSAKPKAQGGLSMISSQVKSKMEKNPVSEGLQSKEREKMFVKLQNFDKGFFEKSDLAVGTDSLFF